MVLKLLFCKSKQIKITVQAIVIFILYFFAYICRNIISMKESLTIRLDEELLTFLRDSAKKDFRNVNNYIEMILLKHMHEKQETEKPGE